jgi:hypothetical protein
MSTFRFGFYSGSLLTNSAIVLDPIQTKGLTPADVDNLTRDTREKMLDAITAMGRDQRSLSVKSKKDS